MESQTLAKSYEETAPPAITGDGHGAEGGADGRGPRLTRRERLIALGMLVAGLAALTWLAFNNPLGQSVLPRCPTEQYAGVYCPGCGATRATHHLLQGRAGTAMGYNPLLVVVGVPVVLYTLASLGYQAAAGRRFRRWALPGYVGWAAVVVVVGFLVVRNLPGERFDALRPTPVEVDQARFDAQAGD